MSRAPLNALRTFEAVVRLGSFRAASEALFVTQSAVSHQIRHLEEWFEVPLFDRQGQRPVLLPWGEALGRELALAFADIETACRHTRTQAQPDVLVVAAIPSVAVCWLIPRLSHFHAEHPKVQLRVIYAHHSQQIDFNIVDLALVFSDTKPSGPRLCSRRFLSGSSIPVCSPRILEGSTQNITPAGLMALGLLHDTDSTGWRLWFERCAVPVPEVMPGPVFEDFNLLRTAALAGQGVALCPLAMIQPDLTEGRLVQLSDISVLEHFDYYLIQSERHPGHETSPSARDVFVEWLEKERKLALC